MEGLNILKRDYNIDVRAMFLIDRHEIVKSVNPRLISNFEARVDLCVRYMTCRICESYRK